MSGDAFDRLERELRGAVRAQVVDALRGEGRRPRWSGRLSRRGGLLAVGAALVLGGGALAATQVLEVGAPVPDPPLPKPTPTVGAGVVTGKPRILPLRVTDPNGGPPWALRTFTSSRGGSCVQVGQVLDGRFGRVLPGAGGRLQLRPVSATPGLNSLCGFVARDGYPVLRGLRTVEVTGGDGDPRRCGGAACPITAVRTIRYGLLGPAARSATYVDGAGDDGPTMRLDGAHGGAYLFVVRTNPAPYVAAERWQHRRRAASEAERRRPPAAARASSQIRDGVDATFADGTVLRVAGRGRTAGPLPGVTRAPATGARVSVRVPLRITHRGSGARATYTVRFHAPVAIRRGDHHYVLTTEGRAGPRCDRPTPGGSFATTRDLARGASVSFTVGPGFTGWNRTTWCPGRHVLRVGYATGTGPSRGRLVGSYAFTVSRG